MRCNCYTFQALTICLLLSGFSLIDLMTLYIWSSPQLLHWCPYTGPRLPLWSAHSSQILTLLSFRNLIFVSPLRNQRSSTTTPLKKRDLVVTAGKPFCRSYSALTPNLLIVPVPVRSSFFSPVFRTSSNNSRYSFTLILTKGARAPVFISDQA